MVHDCNILISMHAARYKVYISEGVGEWFLDTGARSERAKRARSLYIYIYTNSMHAS